MKRIPVQEIRVGMIVHDEEGPETFSVAVVGVSEHSTQVYGFGLSTGRLNYEVTRLFINDETVWQLSD